jgi:hypothetical protein
MRIPSGSSSSSATWTGTSVPGGRNRRRRAPRRPRRARGRRSTPTSAAAAVGLLGGDPLHAGGSALAASTREVVRQVAPDVPPRFRAIEEVVSESLADRRFNAVLLGAFGAAALFLAVLGIYGVVAYGVTERTREIGLRMALGARPNDVLGLVVGQGFRLVAAGLAFGLVLAFGLTRLLSSLLFQVGAADPRPTSPRSRPGDRLLRVLSAGSAGEPRRPDGLAPIRVATCPRGRRGEARQPNVDRARVFP